MCTPITWLGETRGILSVCAREAGWFDEGDLEVVEAFARFASLALHNAESFEERERQAQVQRGFYRIAQVLGFTLSRAETLDALAQAACDALGGDAALVLGYGAARPSWPAPPAPGAPPDDPGAEDHAMAWPFALATAVEQVLASPSSQPMTGSTPRSGSRLLWRDSDRSCVRPSPESATRPTPSSCSSAEAGTSPTRMCS